jgi:mxaA protein
LSSASRLRSLALAALLAFGAGAALAVEPWHGMSFAATVEQPRNVGYLIGDLLVQRVELELEGDRFDPRELPQPGRVNAWFERRSARIERDPQGRRWLAVEYQVINAPPALAAVSLPAWKLAPAAGNRGLLIADWPVSVGAMTPAEPFGADTLDALRPDRPAPVPDAATIRHLLTRWACATVAVLAAWLAWLAWRNWQSARSQPFALAARELQRLGPLASETPAAWQALHRAFDRTAGRAIHAGDLPALFQRAPHLAALRAQIEGFYTRSSTLFFGAAPFVPGTGAGTSAATFPLAALCTALRRLEKAHEP